VKLLVALLLALCAARPAAPQAAPAADGVDPQLAAAFARFDAAAGEAREAARREIEALAAKRDSPNAALLVGSLWVGRREWKSSVPHLRRATAAMPEFAPAWNALGAALLQDSRPDEAEEVLRPAVARFASDPVHGDLLFNLAMACAMGNKRLEASEWFEKAIARAPDAAITHFSLAENELNLHRLDRAEAGFRKAMTLTPGHPDARWKLAVTLGQLDRAEEAEALFKQAIATGAPKSRVSAALQYGIFLFERGRHADALPHLEATTRAKPDDRMAWSWLARTQKALGKKEEAAASIARYRELQAQADREETDFLLGLIRDKLEGGDRKSVPDRG